MERSVERGLADGCESIQIFTRAGRSWYTRALEREEVDAFRSARRRAGVPVVAHGSYLINLGSEPGEQREKSIDGFVVELQRCELLGIEGLVFHPGSHPDVDVGLKRVAEGLDEVFRRTPGFRTKVLLEVTAGQGNSLGHRLEHLAAIRDLVSKRDRTGVCLDTCHLFMAGYDLRTRAAYEAFVADCERILGLDAIRAFHLNDCKKPFGSRVDRHEEIGQGTLGLEPFRWLVNDPRFERVPALLETPVPEDYAKTLTKLRGLRATSAQVG
jgi:deoxyribonuclease-4